MKKFLMMLGISCLALTIEAQAQSMVQVEAPADADVTITEQQRMVPSNIGGYNNSDMKPLPDNPGVEVEPVEDALTPQMETETDIDVQEVVPVPAPAMPPNGNMVIDTTTQISD